MILSVYVATETVLLVSPAAKVISLPVRVSKSDPNVASHSLVLTNTLDAVELPSRVIVKVAVSPSVTLTSTTEYV